MEIGDVMKRQVTQDDFTHIKRDGDGNPRAVVHFVHFIRDDEQDLGTDKHYALAVKRANTIGGRRFHNKQYGGGIVFQANDLQGTCRLINKLMSNKKSGSMDDNHIAVEKQGFTHLVGDALYNQRLRIFKRGNEIVYLTDSMILKQVQAEDLSNVPKHGITAEYIMRIADAGDRTLSREQAQAIIDEHEQQITEQVEGRYFDDSIDNEIFEDVIWCDNCGRGTDIIPDTPTDNGSYQMWDGQTYCEKCKEEIGAVSCANCEKYVPITQAIVKRGTIQGVTFEDCYCPKCVSSPNTEVK